MSLLTWSPFQSSDVREICRHMTTAEVDRLTERSLGYGVWVVVSVIIPVRIIMNSDAWWAWMIAGMLLGAHAAVIPMWQRSTRRFLLATEWAQSRGYPENLRMFSIPTGS